ncbi:MAG: toll/interleukin-1 receptor domain-containing protein [Candidatus Thiodiazotropha sp.]
MSHVFISYSRQDEEKADQMESRLRRACISAYIDQGSIDAGDEWKRSIDKAIASSFAVVVICTSNSINSLEVVFEWSYAMGIGIPVVPVVYEDSLTLHTRLSSLQSIEFIEKKPWSDLVNQLSHLKSAKTRPVGIYESGISAIYYSREALTDRFRIETILDNIKANTELLVVARSCEAWARQYVEMERAISNRAVSIKLAMVNPELPPEQWMIKGDWAVLDVQSTVAKLNKIAIGENSNGSIELHILPNSPPISFVSYETEECKMGIVELGANLALEERVCIVIRDENASSLLLERLIKVYRGILSSGELLFSKGSKNNATQ